MSIPVDIMIAQNFRVGILSSLIVIFVRTASSIVSVDCIRKQVKSFPGLLLFPIINFVKKQGYPHGVWQIVLVSCMGCICQFGGSAKHFNLYMNHIARQLIVHLNSCTPFVRWMKQDFCLGVLNESNVLGCNVDGIISKNHASSG